MGYIFKPIRWVLGQIIIFIDWVSAPKPIQRSEQAQQVVDENTKKMALYHFKQCPFCVKTRRKIKALGLTIETRDARNDKKWHDQLINEGGKYQVPCLQITQANGDKTWLYESVKINQYLQENFSS